MRHTFEIATPQGFSYAATVGSHGWLRLAPFYYNDDTGVLSRVERLFDGSLVKLWLSDAGEHGLVIEVEAPGLLAEPQRSEIEMRVGRCLSLHWDLSDFYQFIGEYPQYEWVIEQGAGRKLVGTTVWEDLAKTLLTTNTTWRQTIAMNQRLCTFGRHYKENEYAFPTPHEIASQPFDAFAETVRLGYRAAYLHELTRKIDNEELDVEAWYRLHDSEMLYRKVKSLKGFGDYAAGTMLRLLGHFDKVAIDTECRAAYKRITGSDDATDKAITAYYEQFDQWRGLIAWMDVMSG